MNETIRAFLAVPVTEALADAIVDLSQRLDRQGPGVRWAPRAGLHLTLAFLGDMNAGLVPGIEHEVARACERCPTFELDVVGLGAFPAPERARVLWAGLEGAALSALMDLQRDVVRAAVRAGRPPVDDRFSPHVTIGRSRNDRGPNLAAIVKAQARWRGGTLPVAEVVLYQSTLAPEGPIYAPVFRSSLALSPEPDPS